MNNLSPTNQNHLYARLLIEQPGIPAIIKDILRPTTLIGSAEGCNIQLVSPMVAHVHTVITLENDQFRLRDLRTHNGTHVNSERVEFTTLNNDDVIQIGGVLLRLETNLYALGSNDQSDTQIMHALHHEPNAAANLSQQDPQQLQSEGAYARLQFQHSSGSTGFKDILKNTTLIGSSPNSNIQLISDGIAPAHSMITLESEKLVIRDLRTKLGTKVNGKQVEVATLHGGDQIEVGPFLFTCDMNLNTREESIASLHDTQYELRTESGPHSPIISPDILSHAESETEPEEATVDQFEKEREELDQREEQLTQRAVHLNQEFEQLEKLRTELQLQKTEIQLKTTELEEQLKQQSKQQDELDQKLNDLESRESLLLSSQQQFTTKQEKWISERTLQEEQFQAEEDHLKRKQAELAEALQKQEEQLSELTSNEAALQSRQESLQAEQEVFLQKQEEAEQEWASQHAELSELHEKLIAERTAFEHQALNREEEQQKLESDRNEFSQQQEELLRQATELREMEDDLSVREQELTQREQSLQQREQELLTFQTVLEETSNQQAAEIESLQAEIAELNQSQSDQVQAQQKVQEEQLLLQNWKKKLRVGIKSMDRARLRYWKLLRLDAKESVNDRAIAKSLLIKGEITRFQAEWMVNGKLPTFNVAHYRIEDLLDTGGMGWLYLGIDTENKKPVVVKLLSHKILTDPSLFTRFKLEAKAGLRVNHPNVVRTLEMGQDGEIDFLITEFVEGINLSEYRELLQTIPWKQACDFALQTARGLQAIHAAGMIHRDIKPSNLIIDHAGNLKILDFGLAMANDDEDEFTLAMVYGHDCVGTADYIAPEQSLDSFKIGPEADLYSLGCALYVWLTGKVPYPVKPIREKLEGHRTGTPTPIQELNPQVPEEVVDIVTKLMQKDPTDRYQSPEEVIADLSPLAQRQHCWFDYPAVHMVRSAEARARLRLQAESLNKQTTAAVDTQHANPTDSTRNNQL